MSPHKNYFTEFHDFNGGKVIMGNNTVCQILGIGNVNFKLHDGIIREFRQVRYVPDRKRNLISLEMLNQIRCSVKIESS